MWDIHEELNIIESKVREIERRKSNGEIALDLAFYSFLAAMAFFAAARLLGAFWFRQEYVPVNMPTAAYYGVMGAYLVAEGFIIIKCLTAAKWPVCLLCAVLYLAALYAAVYPFALWALFWCDLAYAFLVPMLLNRKRGKLKSLANSLIFVALISLYQLVMMFGRAYPAGAKYDAVWQILATIDYKFFLILMLIKKEEYSMPVSGCFFFFGTFGDVCRKIGGFVTRPFRRG